MRILMIHNRHGETARGGAERVVERLMDTFRARGHVVHGDHRTTVGFNALNRLPAPIRAVWHLVDLLNIVAAVRLRATLRRTKPDVVHTHNLVGCSGLTPWVIRRSGVPWVHTLHDVQLITPSGLLTPRFQISDFRFQNRWWGDLAPPSVLERSFLGRWFRSLRRSLFGNPHVVTSPSRWLLQLHRAERFFPESRDVVVSNPIEVPSAIPERRGAVRRFCVVGQVEGQKGIVVLIEAYRQLRAMFPDVSLHIVGSGSIFPLLKRMSRDVRGLVLRGRLDADGVCAAISESDVLVVPSLVAENQPSVILEAFAMGVPVVASRVGGIPELVRDGETGFLTDPGSVEDLVRVLRLCVEDPKRVRGMAAACRAIAEAHAVERVAEQLEGVYTDANAYGSPPSRQPMGSLREG
ncbi:glycosyltransferase [Candidatus Uhrbacteria bacterium]|nr:glycosyltransferase [Candidatus Uhrbacteria bacterium]